MSLIKQAIEESIKEVLTELNVVDKPANVISSKEDWEKAVKKYANSLYNQEPFVIDAATRKAFEIGQIAMKPEWDVQKAIDAFVDGVLNSATTHSGVYNVPAFVEYNEDLTKSTNSDPAQEQPKNQYISIDKTPKLLKAHDDRMGKKSDAQINAELKRDALRRTGAQPQTQDPDAAWKNFANFMAQQRQRGESVSEECRK